MIAALRNIASQVGALLLEWRERGGKIGHWEGTQFKADADRLANEEWIRRLGTLAPGVPVLSEESAWPSSGERPVRYFLIDPIDGTASYAHGFPGFVTQVALIDNARPVLAVVHAPVGDRTWHAVERSGAFLNDRALRSARPPGRVLLIDNYPEPRGIAAELMAALPATGYVECGSIALKAVHVADGTADLFVKDVVVRDWDVAPCDLVLAESGAVLTDSTGQAIRYEGEVEKNGVIAAADMETAGRALAVLNARRRP